ncbi:MAG: 4-(cytidine 5'-diphospho)-2-C-methyl-D-erythritol kinase [Anaerolineaceae bacterium]
MPEALVRRAPAKANLVLEVLAKRDDGYHEVDTVLQELELADEVRVTLGSRSGVTVEGPFAAGVPLDGANLAVKAAVLLAERCGRSAAHVAIHLVKQIPAAGGLGGGASDAAAVLKLLQTPWGASDADLLSVANAIGSDEAFFLKGGTARAQGRGERVQTLPGLARHGIVLFVPPTTIERKTARMFAALDFQPLNDGGVTGAFARREDGPFTSSDVHNTFERVAFDVFVGLHGTWVDLETRIGDAVHLCGAGPTLFWIGSFGEVQRVAAAASGALCAVISTATASPH